MEEFKKEILSILREKCGNNINIHSYIYADSTKKIDFYDFFGIVIEIEEKYKFQYIDDELDALGDDVLVEDFINLSCKKYFNL